MPSKKSNIKKATKKPSAKKNTKKNAKKNKVVEQKNETNVIVENVNAYEQNVNVTETSVGIYALSNTPEISNETATQAQETGSLNQPNEVSIDNNNVNEQAACGESCTCKNEDIKKEETSYSNESFVQPKDHSLTYIFIGLSIAILALLFVI
jgi:hypothetical protein